MSGDGRLVVFQTHSSNLGDGDADAQPDIYVRDPAANTTRLVSRADGDGAKATAGNPLISADGRIVGFESAAASLGVPPASRPRSSSATSPRRRPASSRPPRRGRWATANRPRRA